VVVDVSRILPLGEFVDAEIPRPPALIDQVLPGGTTMIFAGQHKVGKTLFLSQLSMAVASGSRFLWWETVQTPVVYLNHEVAAWSFQDRLRRQLPGFAGTVDGDRRTLAAVRANLHVVSLPDFRLNREKDLELIAKRITDLEAGLVVVDPIRGAFPGDANDDVAVNRVMQGLLEVVVAPTGAAVILGHHTRKPGPGMHEDGSSFNVKGSGAWADAADGIGTFRYQKGSTQTRVLNLTLRHFESIDDLELRFRPAGLVYVTQGLYRRPELAELERAFTEADFNELTIDQIADVLEISRSYAVKRYQAGEWPAVVQHRTGTNGQKLYRWETT